MCKNNIHKYTFINSTPSSNIKINLILRTVNANKLVEYEDKLKFENLCKSGCINHNNKWACPPHSPSFVSYSKKYRFASLVLLYCDLSQFDYVKTEYMKIKASNSILKSRSDKFSRELEGYLGGKMLSNGSCRLCKPCSRKLDGKFCKKPDKMRFSMEAVGLNVEMISTDFFNHKLLWYQNKTAPNYSSVISCVLTNNELNSYQLTQKIKTINLV